MLQNGKDTLLCEIKSGATFSGDWVKTMTRLRGQFGDDIRMKVIYGGDESQKRTGFDVCSWRSADNLLLWQGSISAVGDSAAIAPAYDVLNSNKNLLIIGQAGTAHPATSIIIPASKLKEAATSSGSAGSDGAKYTFGFSRDGAYVIFKPILAGAGNLALTITSTSGNSGRITDIYWVGKDY